MIVVQGGPIIASGGQRIMLFKHYTLATSLACNCDKSCSIWGPLFSVTLWNLKIECLTFEHSVCGNIK